MHTGARYAGGNLCWLPSPLTPPQSSPFPSPTSLGAEHPQLGCKTPTLVPAPSAFPWVVWGLGSSLTFLSWWGQSLHPQQTQRRAHSTHLNPSLKTSLDVSTRSLRASRLLQVVQMLQCPDRQLKLPNFVTNCRGGHVLYKNVHHLHPNRRTRLPVRGAPLSLRNDKSEI